MPTVHVELPFHPAAALAALRRADRRMARLIDQAGPFRLRPEAMGSAFQTLLGAIVNQQLSGQAAATILGRVVALCGGRRQLRPQAILNLSGAALRGAGLSRAKVLAVQDLAARTLEGTVPGVRELRRLDDAQIVERLTAVRGIGVWSVEMLLIFRLGRPDVLPVSDLGVRKGVQLTYGGAELPSPREVLARGERWRPYRSVASWYLWRAVDLSRR